MHSVLTSLSGLRSGKGFFSQTKETSLKVLGQGTFAVLWPKLYRNPSIYPLLELKTLP